MSTLIRILIVDDHAIVHEGLRAILAARPDFDVVGDAYDGEQAVQLAAGLLPDVILMDLVMPRLDGLDAIRQIRKVDGLAHILLLTSFADDERVYLAIKAGAQGYLLKDTPREQLYQAVREIALGEVVLPATIAFKILQEIQRPPNLPLTADPLTPSEVETLRLIAQVQGDNPAAARVEMDSPEIAHSARVILGKLHLADRTHSALYVKQEPHF